MEEYKINQEDNKEEKVKKTINSHDQKIVCALAYLVFFLPLLVIPDSKKGKFHANQGLNLLLVYVLGGIVLGMIPIIGWILLPIFYLFDFILLIIGFVNGWNGKDEYLPVIGHWFNLIR